MIVQIFTLSDGQTPDYSQRVTLSGVEYELRLRWNDYAQYWTLDRETADGVPIATGRTVVLGEDLLGSVPLPAGANHPRPPGALFCWQAAGIKRRPGLTDLGQSHGLYYNDPTVQT